MEKTNGRIVLVFRSLLAISLILFAFSTNAQHSSSRFNTLYPQLEDFTQDFYKVFKNIPDERKFRLNALAREIFKGNRTLLFIDTHQSAISQMARVWSETASYFFKLNGIKSYCAGLSPDTIHLSTIKAMEHAGFIVYKVKVDGGEVFQTKYTYNKKGIILWPKNLKHKNVPQENFLAILLEKNASLNLPYLRKASHKTDLWYDDPSGYIGLEEEGERFDASCLNISVEMFYLFSRVKRLEEGREL